MYSMFPMQSSVVFVPATATLTTSLDKATSMLSSRLDERYSAFIDNFGTAPGAPRNIIASSPVRTTNNRSNCFVAASPTTLTTERSTPLKPAKRDRTEDDDDRQILRCKRNLTSSLHTPVTSHLDGGSQQEPSSTSTFSVSESVERRNLRERRRVKLINVTFATLRNRLPSYCWTHRRRRHPHQQQRQHRDRQLCDDVTDAADLGTSKRPSKVDTLRTAISYIRCLQDLLADDDHRRISLFQTLDSSATETIVPGQYWVTSHPTALSYHSGSPATSSTSSSCEDLTFATSATTAQTSTRADKTSLFTDDILDRDTTMAPIPDIFDWLV